MKKEDLKKALEACLQDKGKRKFTQSVELALNFKGIDFNKQDNRLNLDIVLPNGRGKEVKVAVFADGQLAMDAKNAGADVIAGTEIPKLATDKKALKKMANGYEFLAQPNLMMVVGKHLGQVLGTKGKLPKPVVGSGSIAQHIERAGKTVRIKSKGKYLPVIHCAVGNENMAVDDLAENAEAIYEAVKNKVGGEYYFRSAYVKLTMGKPQKVF